MENRAHALVAGLFVLFLLAGAVGAVFWFGGQREASAEYLVVTQQNVTGLNPQAQVRYRGIRVGRVESIRLDAQNTRNILIRISISRDVPVTSGTVARLGYQGMTGIAHILLEETADSPGVPAAVEGMVRIPMQPSLLQEISDSGSAVLRQAQMLLASANEVLNPQNRDRIARTLDNLESGTADLAGVLAETRKLLADPRIAQIGPAVARIEQAADAARGVLVDVRPLLPRVEGLLTKLDGMVGDPGGEGLASSGAHLKEVSHELTQTLRQMSQTLRALEEAPQSVLFGPPAPQPGPGESGFIPPQGRHP